MNTSNLKVQLALAGAALLSGCGTVPQAKYETFEFPSSSAFVKKVERPFKSLGWVKSKVNFQSLDPGHEENTLCNNYYNKAVRELVETAREKGADAVIEVKSVVFLEDGRREVYATPECSDDGFEGQILLQGIAVQWKKEPLKAHLNSIPQNNSTGKKTRSQDEKSKTQQSPDSAVNKPDKDHSPS